MVILDFSFPSCQNLWPTVGFGRSRKLKRTKQFRSKRAHIVLNGVCFCCCCYCNIIKNIALATFIERVNERICQHLACKI